MSAAGAAAVISLGMSGSAMAQGENFHDYFWAALVVSGEVSEGTFSEDLDGFILESSVGLGDYAFFRARVDNYQFDDGIDIALDMQELGIGGHYPVVAGPVTLSPWGALSYERHSFGGEVFDGYSINLGLRARFLDGDLEAGLRLKTGEISDDDFDLDLDAWELMIAYRVIEKLDIVLNYNNVEYSEGSDSIDFDDIVGLGVRFRY